MNFFLWGSKQSGKTTYLASLFTALSAIPGWSIIPRDEETAEFISSRAQEFESGKFPKPTDPDVTSKYIFDIEIKKTFGNKILSLEFLDPAGEYFNNPGLMKTNENLRESIKKSKGMICLIDPEPESKSKSEYFKILLMNLTIMKGIFYPEKGFTKIDIPTAFCITKMDQYKGYIRNPLGFANKLMGQDSLNVINSFYREPTFNWFGLSSIGFDNEGKANIKLDQDGKECLRKRPRPVNIFESIHWLVKNSGS